MGQKLAPAEKNSTNWLARLARFCNSDTKSRIDNKSFQLVETQVTHIVDEQGWTLKKPLVAKMTSTMVGNLPQPVVILKEMGKDGIAVNGKVILSPKEKRRHYGNLLQKYSDWSSSEFKSQGFSAH